MVPVSGGSAGGALAAATLPKTNLNASVHPNPNATAAVIFNPGEAPSAASGRVPFAGHALSSAIALLAPGLQRELREYSPSASSAAGGDGA
jgi:hypothetical protein